MIKNKTILEVTEGEFKVQTECDPNMPLGYLYNAICKQLAYVIQRIQESQPKEEQKNCEGSCPTQSE